MRIIELITKKQQGLELNEQELEYLIRGYVSGEIPDYQVAAFLMAVYFQGMTSRETALLTRSMTASGTTIDLSGLNTPKIDKHSTGGVGDKISLILAPLAAALGITVPMMAGRGLGHTGGTLDKLESIPGYTTLLPEQRFKAVLENCGFAIIGQSAEIVPADQKLYALRDVTCTVASIPLITASIMSKKIAEGADGLVLDVKCGCGAFMKTLPQAEALAKALVTLGCEMSKQVKAVITRMDQPLGRAVGNFLEVEEAIRCLQGTGPADLLEITLRLCGWMLILAGREQNLEQAMLRCREVLDNGSAWQKFLDNVAAQGGDTRVVRQPGLGPVAAYHKEIRSPATGFVQRVDAYRTGLAAVMLGAGRAKKEDAVSPGAGILLAKKAGEPVKQGEVLCSLFTDNSRSLPRAERLMQEGYTIGRQPPAAEPLILQEL